MKGFWIWISLLFSYARIFFIVADGEVQRMMGPMEVKVDCPFIFMVQANDTVLFQGIVVDPEQVGEEPEEVVPSVQNQSTRKAVYIKVYAFVYSFILLLCIFKF